MQFFVSVFAQFFLLLLLLLLCRFKQIAAHTLLFNVCVCVCVAVVVPVVVAVVVIAH